VDNPFKKHTESQRRNRKSPAGLLKYIGLIILFVLAVCILENIESPYGFLGSLFFKKQHIDRRCVLGMSIVSSLLLDYRDCYMEKELPASYKDVYPLSFTDFLQFCKSDPWVYFTIDEKNLSHPFHGANFPESVKFAHMVSISPRICELGDDAAGKVPFFWRVGTNRFGLCDVQMLNYRETFTGERGISKSQLLSYILAAAGNPDLHYRFYYPGHYLARTSSGDLELREDRGIGGRVPNGSQ